MPTPGGASAAGRSQMKKSEAMLPGYWRPWRQRRRLAVVLSGGANLGAFQVGVIDVLARAGLEPDLLVGTSVGALNAAFWAFHSGADVGTRLLDVWRRITPSVLLGGHPWLALPRLVRGRWLFADAGLVQLLRTALPPDARIEEAAYPLSIAVTRALEGTREAITSGPLEPAILASAAIPGMFPPVSLGGVSYVDGGLVANCDLEAVVEAGIDQAVAVDVMGGGFDKPAPDVMASLTRAVTFMIARQTEMQVRIWGPRLRLAMLRARLTIPPRVDSFVHTEELVELGRHAGERLLAQHLDAGWRVRPGTLEFTLPETITELPLGATPSAPEMTVEETALDAEPRRSERS